MPRADPWTGVVPKTDSQGREMDDRYPFRKNLVARARKRLRDVWRVGANEWMVAGRPDLSDTYPRYQVGFDSSTHKYFCECWTSSYGDARAKSLCSHMVAVVVWRREVEPTLEVVTVEPEPEAIEHVAEVIALPVPPPPQPIQPAIPPATLPPPSDPYWGDPPWPDWLTEFRPWQIAAALEIVAKLSARKVVFLQASTGCLAGDTRIAINRQGKGYSETLENVVAKQNGGSVWSGKRDYRWNLDYQTRVQCNRDGALALGDLARAFSSGARQTFLVTTANRTIRATEEHPFLTEDGFVPLADLNDRSMVAVNAGRGKKGETRKPRYRRLQGLAAHPFHGTINASGKGEIFDYVPTHRIVAEAALNDLDCEDYLRRLRSGDVEGFRFLDPATHAVHHVDGDSLNNELSNLQVLTHHDHLALEGREYKWRQVALQIGYERIISITPYGIEPTYDLTLAEDPHNYVANGFVVHNSGKTVIAEMVRRVMGTRALYLCSDRQLQAQFMSDDRGFGDYAKMLSGRSNYPTADHPDLFLLDDKDPRRITAADCVKESYEAKRPRHMCDDCPPEDDLGDDDSHDRGFEDGPDAEVVKWQHCALCHPSDLCAYDQAKQVALECRTVTCTNTSYFLVEANGPGRFKNWPLVVVDEADTIEQTLTGRIEVRVSAKSKREMDIGDPQYVTKPESWAAWCVEASTKAADVVASIPKRTSDIREIRRRKHYVEIGKRLAEIAETLTDGNWVYERDKQYGTLTFKPVRVASWGKERLFDHGGKWLMMSATIISAEQMAKDLGLDADDWDVVEVPAVFDVKNRPVRLAPVADMRMKNRDEAWPKMAAAVKRLIDYHPGERVLVHTVSFALASFLHDNIGSPRTLVYQSGMKRLEVMGRWQAGSDGVLLAPAMERGLDLRDDMCRVAVIVQLPLPSLGDEATKKRLYEQRDQVWYDMLTIRAVIQGAGRVVRHSEDFGCVYVLDSRFVASVDKSWKRLVPKWFSAALVWGGPWRKEIIGQG